MIGKISAIVLGKLASGDFGSVPKTAYWWLAGKKTWIALVFGVIAAGLSWGDSSGACEAVGLGWCGSVGSKISAGISAVMIYLGQVDGALRTEPPSDPSK